MIAPESRILRLKMPLHAGASRSRDPLPAASMTIRPLAVAAAIASKVACSASAGPQPTWLSWLAHAPPQAASPVTRLITPPTPTHWDTEKIAYAVLFVTPGGHAAGRAMDAKPADAPEAIPVTP